jgi:hypothetical protein
MIPIWVYRLWWGSLERRLSRRLKRVWKRLQDWKIKFLSQPGKEILLKAVIQAIPTYSMNVFLLQKSLCTETNSLMQKFWWGHQDKEWVHWISWSRLGISKSDGGMGYRDFRSFNKALLAKQAWRLWNIPNSLTSQIMEAEYYRGGNFLESLIGKRPSFAWRSIHSSQELLKEGLIWRIGNDSKVRIWKDRWVPSPSTYRIQSLPVLLNADSMVSELIDVDTRWWKIELLESLFSREEVQSILSLPVSFTNREDVCIWRGSKNGIFTVRSAYYIQKELEKRRLAKSSSSKDHCTFWRKIWDLRVPNVEFFFFFFFFVAGLP